MCWAVADFRKPVAGEGPDPAHTSLGECWHGGTPQGWPGNRESPGDVSPLNTWKEIKVYPDPGIWLQGDSPSQPRFCALPQIVEAVCLPKLLSLTTKDSQDRTHRLHLRELQLLSHFLAQHLKALLFYPRQKCYLQLKLPSAFEYNAPLSGAYAFAKLKTRLTFSGLSICWRQNLFGKFQIKWFSCSQECGERKMYSLATYLTKMV